MPCQVTQNNTAPADEVDVHGVACLLMAIEAAGQGPVTLRPMARLGEDFVAATVMIDLGDGPIPFPLEAVRLAARCLRADPPFFGAVFLAHDLSLAADAAQAQALRLLGALN